MHRWQAALVSSLLLLLCLSGRVRGQVQPPSDKLLADANIAYTWSDGTSDIVQLEGPVTITLDHMTLTARQAVIWLTPEPGVLLEQQRAEIVLLGDAQVTQPARGITRSGPRLLVTVSVRGSITLTANQRTTGDQSATPIFQRAAALRNGTNLPAPGASPNAPLRPDGGAKASTGPPAATRPSNDVQFHADLIVPTPGDEQGQELSGNVNILLTRPDGDFVEIHADRAVVFTRERPTTGPTTATADRATGAVAGAASGRQVSAAYLEGDVRIDYVPAAPNTPDDRLTAQRVYYDFDSNQAVLTDAVLRSNDPTSQVPITVRAGRLHQLAAGEYRGEKVEMSTSSFATPTYSVKTDEVYIHQEEVFSPYFQKEEPQTSFVAGADTFNFFDTPVFYYPSVAGSIDQDPFPLRSIDIGNSSRFGFGVATEFGLFESIGRPPPKGVDVSFLADYFDARGPATGLNGTYTGSNLNSDSKDLTDYEGMFKSFIISDRGEDQLGADRTDVKPPDDLRGKFLFEHQQFLPDHWQVQLRLGYSSDPTYLEEWDPKDFFTNQPYDAMAYIKRQQDTEAFTFQTETDTNRFPSTSDQQQEQFDVEKLPELGYRRIGDSLADDNINVFSENTFDRLRFEPSHYTIEQQGFDGISPGLPSEGYTGVNSTSNLRGDSREEVDYPIQLDQIKLVPYAIGRATAYSDSPEDDGKQRIYGAMGVRMTTDFWKVDDSAESDLFDIHRVRHVIEPEINLYTSGETLDRSNLYIYEENVDGIADVSAMELALHQRWETYRGVPGKQESVSFLSWNISSDTFTNSPTDAGLVPVTKGPFAPPNNLLLPIAGLNVYKFRGEFFPSAPETSIPRDAINSDATWLITDSTALLADISYNVDHAVLATASIGLAVERYDRLAYYLGLRYIEQLNSDLATVAVQYQLTSKYTMQVSQSYDFGSNKNTDSTLSIRRQFDRVSVSVGIFHDSATGDNGFQFNIYPEGLGGTPPDIAGFLNAR